MDYIILQVTEKSVDVALFSFAGRQVALKGAQSFELSSEHDLSNIAETIGAGLNGNPKVVLTVPATQVVQRIVALPLSDLRKVREVLPPHLQGETTVPVEELVFDAIPATDGSFLALWAKKNYLLPLLDTFRGAGCEPHHISTIPSAWPYLPGLEPDDALFDGTTLCMMSNGRISMMTSFSGESCTGQLLTYLAALELSGTVFPKRLVLLGKAANQTIDAAEPLLPTVRLELPDELGGVFKNEETFRKLAGMYAVACACHQGKLVDFRRGDMACTQGDAGLRKKLAITVLLALTAVMLLFGAKIMQYRSANADIASLNSSISTMYREVFPGRTKAVDELAEIKGEIKKLSGTGSSRSLVDLLKMLADAKVAGINAVFEAEMDGSVVRLKGDAVSAKAAADFKTALGELLSPVQLGETRSRPDGTVAFTITGTLKEGK